MELVEIVTRGDRFLDVSLSKIGGKGLFVKEIEQALLDRRIDLAVHSMKDVPAEMDGGLVVAAVPPREDPRDALVSRDGRRLEELPPGAVVGTSSLRRVAQLSRYRRDLRFIPLRGNVDTRLRKLDGGEVEAVVLAAAGLIRLGLGHRIVQYLDPEICVPAAGQGALAVQCRADDEETRTALAALDDPDTRKAVEAERACLAGLGGGCQVPAGAYAEIRDGQIRLTAVVARPEGSELLRAVVQGDDPVAVGRKAARDLIDLGADAVLLEARKEAEIGGRS